MTFRKIKNVFFVGIGGIGMSGLAYFMKGLGFKIQGCDIALNKNIEWLYLSSSGHRRSFYDYSGRLVKSGWLAP